MDFYSTSGYHGQSRPTVQTWNELPCDGSVIIQPVIPARDWHALRVFTGFSSFLTNMEVVVGVG